MGDIVSAKFYSEELGITIRQAYIISCFMEFAIAEEIDNPTPWASEGVARVYFDIWSQNKLYPIQGYRKAFFDADGKEIFIEWVGGKHELSNIANARINIFSGSKTRKEIERLSKEFEEWRKNILG